MKQLQFTFNDQETLEHQLLIIKQWNDGYLFSEMFLQLYTEILDRKKIETVLKTIEEYLPDAAYMGCSSNGNIVNGDLSRDSFALICTFFEFPSTKAKIFQYSLTEETMQEVSQALAKKVDENEWVKCVGFVLTIRGMSLTGLCEGLSEVRDGVQLFGGGAFSGDIDADEACVFSKESGFQQKGIVFVLLGGEDLHVSSSYVCGWKPLGSSLNVTAAEGCILKELNGIPAYETYYKYLNIQNDENFFYNTLEFPFIYQDNGIGIMRAPTDCNPDGSLVMTSDIRQDVKVRLAYGDPWTILESAKKEADRLVSFSPEGVFVFSCAGRRTFWGNDRIGKETEFYQKIAPTSGFYTSSEFLRIQGHVLQHNVTQVIAALREGKGRVHKDLSFSKESLFEGRIPMISRMAAFIKTTSEELEEANRKLSLLAITDGLTGLLNRRECQLRITSVIENNDIDLDVDIYLIMMDLDGFKQVNDKYGHKEGDNVLIRISGIMKETMVDLGDACCCGRWGGEEFMIMIQSRDKAAVMSRAEWIRKTMEGIHFERAGQVTISIGIIKVLKGESADQACIRVDKALYEAKNTGKNKVVFLENNE